MNSGNDKQEREETMPAFNDVFSDMDLAEAYSLAIVMEEEGVSFYQNLMDKLDNPRIINELRYLRDEEGKHISIFKDLLRASGCEFTEKKESLLHSWVRDEVLGPMREAVTSGIPDSIHEILRTGLVLEEKSIQMFKRIRQASSDSKVIRALDVIIGEEEEHRLRLNVIMAF